MTTRIFEWKDETKILAYLVKNFPKSLLIFKIVPESEQYKTITKWCKIETDLKPYDENLQKTGNGILFYPAEECFIEINEDVVEEFRICINIDPLLPKEMRHAITIREETSFVKELIFADATVRDELRAQGAIGESFDLDNKLIE